MFTEQAREMVLPRFTWISWEPIILARTAATKGESKLVIFVQSLGTRERNYFLKEMDFNCIRR